MVTRKVARSKRDALALAEAQLRGSESGPEAGGSGGARPQGRRAAQVANAARAREAKARAAATKGPVETGATGDPKASATNATAPHTAPLTVVTKTPRQGGSTISTRNRGARRVTPTSAAARHNSGVSQTDVLREELERKLQLVDPAITDRFGNLVWAKRAAFPFWPALILDPRLLPEHQLPSAVKEMDEKCWVQLYGSRDIRQILFSALADWNDTSHPYQDGFPRSDFHRLTKLKDTFVVALEEARDQEKLTAEERLSIFKTEVAPSLGLPIPAPLPGIRRRRKVAKVSKPSTPTSQENGKSGPTTDTPGTLQASLANGMQNKAGTSEADKRKRHSAFVTQVMRGSESESRYRLGQLIDYAARLRKVHANSSPDRNWRVQLLLSQLLDEKAFLRQDLETAGIWDVLELIRESENERWRELVETVRVHLNNCTLEEWPSARKSTIMDVSAQKRPTSAPLLADESDGSSNPKRMRGSGSSSIHEQPVDILPGNGRSTAEAMAEAVARSMISRASIHRSSALRVNLTNSSDSTSASSSAAETPFILSTAAMASVGISPGLQGPAQAGSSSAPLNGVSNTLDVFAPQPTPHGSVGVASSSMGTTVFTGSSASQPVFQDRATATAVTGRKKTSSARANGPPPSVSTSSVSAPAQGLTRSNPSLVIFNKDGTLLDFQTTWTSWIESQAWRLETGLGKPVRDAFFCAIGYNAHTRTMRKGSVFNSTVKHELGPRFAVQFLQKQGLQPVEAVRFVNQHWALPKEVATFRARLDLPSLFRTIRELGVKIAIVTTDRRDVTSKTLTHLGVGHLVDAVSCGDDGISNTPDRIWALCSRLGVSTANTVMVGDTADDMVLARSAGCALAVGVMGGAAELSDLSSEADFLVPSVTNVIKLLYQYRQQAAAVATE